MRWKALSQFSLLAFMLSGCASDGTAIQVAPLPQVDNQVVLQEAWETQIGKGVGNYFSRLSPVYAYDKFYVAAREGEIAALDLTTGKEIWSIHLGEEKPALLSGGLTAAYDKIFVGSETGYLIALDAETGEQVWETNVSGELLSRPLADENLIVVNTSRGELAAFNAETGDEKWRISGDVPNLTLRGDSSPVSTSGGVFWGMANGRLGAALLENGNLIWQQVIASPKGATEIDRLVDVDATPVIADYLLYAIGYNGYLVAIDLRSGQAVWKREYSSSTDFTVSGNTIILKTDKDHVIAVDGRSGTKLWENAELAYRELTSPVRVDDEIIVGDAEGYLHWIDINTGEFVAQRKINSSGIASAPIDVDDALLVVTRNGDITKLNKQ